MVSWQQKRSKICSELTFDSPAVPLLKALSPSHSPRSPPTLTLHPEPLHCSASEDPRIAACQPFPFDFRPVSCPSCDPRTSRSLSSNEVQNPLPSRTAGCPPECDPPRTVVLLLPSVTAPDLATVKDLIRFYIATSKPQLDKVEKRPTADSINKIGRAHV